MTLGMPALHNFASLASVKRGADLSIRCNRGHSTSVSVALGAGADLRATAVLSRRITVVHKHSTHCTTPPIVRDGRQAETLVSAAKHCFFQRCSTARNDCGTEEAARRWGACEVYPPRFVPVEQAALRTQLVRTCSVTLPLRLHEMQDA